MHKNSKLRLFSLFKSFSEYASISIIVVGVVVIIGWILNIESLKSISPEFASMKVNTAISFILAGIALFLLQERRANLWTIRIAKGCSVIVALAGFLTLIEYIFACDIGIDQLLFKDVFPDKVSSFPGRMSPNTALNCLLTAMAIFLLDVETRKGFRPAQFFAVILSVISMFALLCYVYNVESLYVIPTIRGMALHTVITFLLVYVAVLSSRPDCGIMTIISSKYAGGVMARRLLIFTTIVLPLLGWLRLIGQRAGLYDTEFGLAIVIMVSMLVFAAMIWRTALTLNKNETERKDTEELLLKSSKILNESQEIAHIGSCEWDIVKNELYWSDEIYRIFGLSRKEFGATYEAFLHCVHPDDREFLKRSVNEALYDKKPYDIDHRIVLRNGDIRTVHERAAVDYNELGKPVRMVGTVQDITERKCTEEEAGLLQTVTMAIVKAKDLPTALNAVLQLVCETTGWISGEVWTLCPDSKNIKRCHTWHSNIENFDDFSKKSKEFLFSIGTGFPGRIWSSRKPEWITDATVNGRFPRANIAKETGFKAAVGIPVIINDEVIAVLNFFVREKRKEDERFIKLITTIATQLGSVIQRRLMEDALRESEERLQSILNNAPSSIYLKNLKGQYTFVNSRFINLFNIKGDELINKTDYDLFSKEIANTLRANDQKVIEANIPMGFDEILSLKDGLHAYISVKFPLFDSNGAVYAVCGILTDITERNKAELEKEALREQLYHAQKLDSVGRLAGGIAHDFNNILMVIVGYASMLKMRVKEDVASLDYLEKIMTSSERAANLARGLLIFSRKQSCNPEPANLNEIVNVSEDILKRLIPESITLETRLTDKDCIIMADRGQIEQVLMNLATNARDAMPEGGFLGIRTNTVEIDDAFIKKHGFGKVGMYATLSVSDTGTGMDEKTRDMIFEPFFTTKEVGKGTGLGLAIVYGIVTQHNGYIDVESELGKGSIFTVYLPIVKQEIVKAKAEIFVMPSGGTETILVAEDEGMVRNVAKKVLEQQGYKVIEAVDGENAICKFIENKDRIQLLLFDVIMPYKNGKDAYDEIRKMKPGIKALFMSGYSEDIIQNQYLVEDGIKLISKPISTTELLRGVREALDK